MSKLANDAKRCPLFCICFEMNVDYEVRSVRKKNPEKPLLKWKYCVWVEKLKMWMINIFVVRAFRKRKWPKPTKLNSFRWKKKPKEEIYVSVDARISRLWNTKNVSEQFFLLFISFSHFKYCFFRLHNENWMRIGCDLCFKYKFMWIRFRVFNAFRIPFFSANILYKCM